MIEVRGLTKIYKAGGQTYKAVENATFTVEKGRMVSIMGHSGSGKTTLLSLIGGLTRPDSGTVAIDGIDLWSVDDNALSAMRNRKMSFIYQFSSLIPTLTVFENVLLPLAFGDTTEDAGGYALELLGKVGLKDKVDVFPSQLSGGQQRRAAIARAFINRPEIVLADEPTGDLDEETEREIMVLFRTMNRDKGMTFVIVTHSSELAAQADVRMRMTHGVVGEVDDPLR
jgi:putative ABC transport system ATP-binding protein/lipoprotein-releasing system ATP-binding protein